MPSPPTCGYIDFHQTVDAYVTFTLPSPENDVYVEVTGLIDAASLAAIYTEYGSPGSLLVTIDDPAFPTCREELWLYDNGFTGAYNSIQDYNFGSITASGPTDNVPFTLKIWMRNSTPVGQYFSFDADTETIDNSGCGAWLEVLVGLRSPNGNTIPGAGAHWLVTAIKVGTTNGGSDLLDFDATVATNLSDFTTTGAVTLVECTPPPPGASRFYQGYEWRFIVTNLQLDVLSWMQGLMTNRRILLTANQAAVIDTDVFPDDFRVNGLVFDPGSTTISYPRLAQSNRIIFAYRREGDSSIVGVTPWQCKAAGIIMALEDQGDTDVPLSHVTAYDPWKLLEARPAMNNLGELPDQLGFLNTGPGSTTALQYLKDTIENEGGVYIDAGVAWGGTASYGSAGGVLETTPDVVMTVQQGQSVADVWSALVDGGNMDIQLIPIYDPLRQIVVNGTVYFFTHELSIKNVAGSKKPSALMGWDKLNHCINRIDRMHDATPGAFFDKIQYFAGQGGIPVPLTPLVDSATLAEFGSYWSQQFFPSLLSADPTGSMTYALAVLALRLVKQGRRTLTLDLSSGLGPIPLSEYDLFDLVPVHASDALRVTVDGYLKVEAIPITIDDNGVESVNGLVLSPDYRTQSYP